LLRCFVVFLFFYNKMTDLPFLKKKKTKVVILRAFSSFSYGFSVIISFSYMHFGNLTNKNIIKTKVADKCNICIGAWMMPVPFRRLVQHCLVRKHCLPPCLQKLIKWRLCWFSRSSTVVNFFLLPIFSLLTFKIHFCPSKIKLCSLVCIYFNFVSQ